MNHNDRKIVIRKNPNGDTRTAPDNVTFEEFQKANDMHRKDVREVLCELGWRINGAGLNHDITKKTREREFYEDFLKTKNEGANFVLSDWYKMHVFAERHHLTANCPADVTLIDILEMIADCVCAGMARSGEVYGLDLDPDILDLAMKNTVQMVKDMIEVEDDK